MIEFKALFAALVALDQNEPRDLLTAEEPAIFFTMMFSVVFAAVLISFLIIFGAIAAVAMPPTPAINWPCIFVWFCCVIFGRFCCMCEGTACIIG